MSNPLAYLKEFKKEFNHFLDKYDHFLAIFKAFHAKRFVLFYIKAILMVKIDI